MSLSTLRMNFYRIATLIIDHGAESMRCLLEQFVQKKYRMSFRDYVSNHQHEIYHHFNNGVCCQCSRNFRRPYKSFISAWQMEKLFDKNSPKFSCHKYSSKCDYCCSSVKSTLLLQDIDITLLRFFLITFFEEEFWQSSFSSGMLFHDFLNMHKHDIYHLLQLNTPCCLCIAHPGYTTMVLNEKDRLNRTHWETVFHTSELPCTQHRNNFPNGYTLNPCSVSATIGIRHSDLNGRARMIILSNLCTLMKHINQLVHAHNTVIGHATKGEFSNEVFRQLWTDINNSIVFISKITGTEHIQSKRISELLKKSLEELTVLDVTGQFKESVHKDNVDMFKEATVQQEENAVDVKIPDEIKRLSIERYCQLLKGKKEKRQHFRLVVVGPKGSGKTSLVRRILQHKPLNPESTNGIDIHIMKCKIQTNIGKWIFMEGVTNRQVANMRLKRCLVEGFPDTIVHDTAEETNILNNDAMESKITVIYSRTQENISKSDTSPTQTIHNSLLNIDVGKYNSEASYGIEESEDVCIDTPTIKSEEDIYRRNQKNISVIDLAEVLNVKLEDQEFATIDLWDFAGYKEFYNTHQIFLSKEALYIVTVDMEKDVEKVLGIDEEDPNFWLQTLHYYGQHENSSDLDLEPPIILVGTKMDLCQGNDNESRKMLSKMFCKQTSFQRHIRHVSLLSNTQENNEDVFKKLRLKIFDIAKACPSWNQELPVSWIHLEKTLFKLSNERPIVTRDDVIKLGFENLEPIKAAGEIDLFLKYHHETGDFVFFDDIPEYVVLSPQWLSNAFKCIVTSDDLQSNFDVLSWKKNDWDEIRKTGKLSNRFIDHVLEINKLSKYKSHILNIMEKYDIMVRSVSASGEENFYVPCMVETTAVDDIDFLFYNKSKTSCLCFVFDFLPMPIFNHVLAACTRRYKVTIKDDTQVFFKGICLFDLDNSGCEKLLLLMYQNVIQVQVWKWMSPSPSKRKSMKIDNSYGTIRKLLCSDIERVQVNRCKSNKPYKTQLKCNITSYSCLRGMKDSDELMKMEEYYCEEHEQSHDAKQIYSDWYDEDPNESLNDLNHKHINFTKMGIITLDILADALYDLILVADPNFKTPRNECDITKLYAIHRHQLKVFIPTRGCWGGKWVDLKYNDTNPGDDIERIRLTRNDLLHSKKFELQDAQFFQLCTLHRNVLARFETKNKVRNYVQRLEHILTQKMTFLDWSRCKENIVFVCAKVKLQASVTTSKGSGCTIICDIISPLPVESTVCWLKNSNGKDEALIIDRSNGKYHGSTIEYPSLVIRSVDEGDEGFYSCRILYPPNYLETEESETVLWPRTYLHVKDK